MTAPAAAAAPSGFDPGPLRNASRWRWPEFAFWILALACAFLFPSRYLIMTDILRLALFALSLDLILGYAGIVTLGHAAFFGIGAYTVGLLIARMGWSEPISSVIAAGLVAGFFGFLFGVFLLRYRGLTLLMLTLATAIMVQETGNLRSDISGGYDGLPGLVISPLFGHFDYDLYGHVNYLYVLGVLAIVFYGVRRVVHSPFGQALTGIRENVRRMPAIGVDVNQRLRVVFAIAAGVAGIAGAVMTQTTQLVGIDSLGFQRSAEVLIMLVFGGAGRLYGALVGATVFIVAQDALAGISPDYWQFWLGAVLVVLVLIARGGLLGALDALRRRVKRRR